MSTFSYNLLVGALWFEALRLLAVAALATVIIAQGGRFRGGRGAAVFGGRAWVIPMLFFLLGLGTMFAVGFATRGHGRVEAVEVVGEGPQAYVAARFSQRGLGKSSSYETNQLMTFGLDGEVRGASATHRGLRQAFSDGDLRILEGGDGLVVFVGPELRRVGEVKAALQPHISGPHRVRGFEGRAVEVERADGRTEAIGLDTLFDGLPPPAPTTDVSKSCRVSSQGGRAMQDLLRASALSATGQRCRWPREAGQVQLVLHRSTAFGPGAFLLSARADSGRLWTTDITPALGGEARFSVLAPRWTDAALEVWVLRAQRSLSRLRLDAKTGALLAADVVF